MSRRPSLGCHTHRSTLTRCALRGVLLSALLAAALFPAFADEPAPSRSLFLESSAQPWSKSGMLSREPGTLRERAVAFDTGVLTPSVRELTLTLFADTSLNVVLDESQTLVRGGRGWVGHVDACAFSEVFLVERDGVLAGSVRCGGRLFQLRPQGRGVVQIREAAADLLDEGPDDAILPPPSAMADQPLFESKVGPVPESAGRIDLMIVYTAQARSAAGGAAGIAAMADLAVLEANTAYENSGVNHRLRLVHVAEVDYVESGDSGTDLGRLQAVGDGYLDAVHDWRNQYGADVVSMWTETGGCGLGYMMSNVSSGFGPWAFNHETLGCATGNYTVPHEIGHNMGARHDWYVDDTQNSPQSYNHGYVDFPNRWRSVMAYNSLCSDQGGAYCERIAHFSNPGVSYGGAPTGIASGTNVSCVEGNTANPACDADVRQMLNGSAATVAAFRTTQFLATLTLGAAPETLDPGETITYTLTAENFTETTATSVVLRNDIPAGTTLDPSSLSGDAGYTGTGPGHTITWTTGQDLAPGGTIVRSFRVYADQSGVVPNQASVSSANGNTAATSNIAETTVLAHGACGFADGFESGAISAYWRKETTANGRVSVSSAYPDSGSYGAILDASSSGTNSLASMIVTLDLASSGQSELRFRWADMGDEYHASYDGVFIREDKNASWSKVYSFTDQAAGVYQDGLVDIDAAAASAGITLGAGFQLKFSQYDNWYVRTDDPGSGDGYAIDGISLYCTPKEAGTGSAGGGALTASGKDTFSWGADGNFTGYRLYRGDANDLPRLADGGVDSCQRWEGTTNSVSGLIELPGDAEGRLFWYLVAGFNGLGEGSAGSGSAGARVLNSSGTCP